MAAATVDIPAITLNGGPMLDGWHDGELVGSGTVIWRSRRLLGAGEIDEEEFIRRASDSAPSPGHCNTMGTASTMNAIAEALGMSLPGKRDDPGAVPRARQMAYETGRRIVDMAYEDLRPSKILTRAAFLNAIRVDRRDRRLDQRPAAHRRHGAPCRRRDRHRGLDGARLRPAAAGQHAARRASISASASTAPAACPR